MDEPNLTEKTRNNGRWVKGMSGNTKGNLHKTTHRAHKIKGDIYDVFELLGGKVGFYDWAKENRKEAYEMIIKILPKEIQGEGFSNGTNVIIVKEKDKQPANTN